MKSLEDITQYVTDNVRYTESPIEGKILYAIRRDKRFVFVRDGDQPQGEGYFIMPQVEMGGYRVDFLIKAVGYPQGLRLWPPSSEHYFIIECDGRAFHTSDEDIAYDKKRDEYFESKGIRTLRYTGSQIVCDADWCVDNIAHILEQAVFNG